MRGTKETRRNNKGITLIALIITIIVMLILVAVTITVAVNGGLFEYAGRAGRETNEAIKKEQEFASIEGSYSTDELIAKYTNQAMTDDWTEPKEISKASDGKYHIKNCAELAWFRDEVNGGNNFAGETIVLDNNLNLQGRLGTNEWMPIGNNAENAFSGTFDGQNHYIEELYCYINGGYAGLFGYVEEASIKNIGIKSGDINLGSGTYAGGIVGYAMGTNTNKVQIYNCYNKASLGTDYYGVTGGIIGEGSYIELKNCFNMGTVTSNGGDGVGGIAGGLNFSKVINCYNTGKIKAHDDYGAASVGGLVGWNEEGRLIIENSYNTGTVYGLDKAGGIVGNFSSEGSIKNCYNIGEIDGTVLGEIAGQARSPITNCYFLGTASDNAVGNNPENVSVDVTAKTEAEMKTQGFVDLLNAGQTTEPWKRDSNKNNGYPILNWQ